MKYDILKLKDMTTVFSNNTEQIISYAQFAIIIVGNKLLSLVKGVLRNSSHRR
jgi:hypothetical protein